MSRYESRLQRCHDKAYAALRELQKSRISQPTPPEPQPVRPLRGNRRKQNIARRTHRTPQLAP
jgi:hypothetical protein